MTSTANDVLASDGARADETKLLERARSGDEGAFAELIGAYRAQLRAHAYRITGSVQDADDVLQEALLRAWRSLAGFAGRGSVRSWLYAIVTNAALDLVRHRSRRELPVAFGPSTSRGAELDPPLIEQLWLEPYPDQWLPDDTYLSPEARYEQRESVELAFLVALQQLAPLQRSVLLLREVVGFSSAEIASQLGASTASVNSALQRARAAARGRLPAHSQQSILRTLGDARTREIVRRYADAIQRDDIDALIAMLTRDATWSMPPVPTWFRGHKAIRQFMASDEGANHWRHVPARANGQLAVGGYLLDQATGRYLPVALDVLTLDGNKIASVTGFLAAEASVHLPPQAPSPGHRRGDKWAPSTTAWITGPRLFARFGLPGEPPP